LRRARPIGPAAVSWRARTVTEKLTVVYYVFDLLHLNGRDLRTLAIEKRKARLEALLAKAPAQIRFSDSFMEHIDELFARA
jgi:ATP-dependent DNA ligase